MIKYDSLHDWRLRKTAYKSKRWMVPGLFLVLVFLGGCSLPSRPRIQGGNLPGNAERIPVEAQEYIDQSRRALANKLELAPDQVTLESITELPDSGGNYQIVLTAGNENYTYRVMDGTSSLVSGPQAATTVPSVSPGALPGVKFTLENRVAEGKEIDAVPAVEPGEQTPYWTVA
ncbi:MAG: hypothetical protein P8Y37_13955, partial [Anaerolineales bacterium]